LKFKVGLIGVQEPKRECLFSEWFSWFLREKWRNDSAINAKKKFVKKELFLELWEMMERQVIWIGSSEEFRCFFGKFFEQIQAFLDFLKTPIKFGDASDLKKEKNLISKILKTLKQIWMRVFIKKKILLYFLKMIKIKWDQCLCFTSESVKYVVNNQKNILTIYS
jgi:hypothetical protein